MFIVVPEAPPISLALFIEELLLPTVEELCGRASRSRLFDRLFDDGGLASRTNL